MKLAEEFQNVTGIARIGNSDDLKTDFIFSVFCGDPDLEQTFCDAENFITADFKSYNDAERCLDFTHRVLELADEHLATPLPVSNSAELRRAVLQAARTGLDEATSATQAVTDNNLIAAVYFAEVLTAINRVFAERGTLEHLG